MSIVGKPITAPTSGLKPELVVTSTAGSTLTVTENGVTKAIYILGETETKHTFKVPLNSVPNPNYHNLPSGFTEVEYIESTGTQCIDTGITANGTTGFKYKASFDANHFSDTQGLIGGHLLNQTNQRFVPIILTGGKIGYAVGTITKTDVSPTANKIYTGDLNYKNNKKVNISDVVSGVAISLSDDVGSNGSTMPIFGWIYNGSVINLCNATLYYAEITVGANVVASFIPCINDSTGKAGLYDTVTSAFYGNSGTGDFLYGDVVTPYLPYAVTATDDTMSFGIDVYVDEVAQYPVTVYPATLYWEGDQCENATGGWQSVIGTSGNTATGITLTFEQDYMQSYSVTGSGSPYYHNADFVTANAIDVTGFTKLKALVYAEKYAELSGPDGTRISLAFSKTKPTASSVDSFTKVAKQTTTGQYTELELSLDSYTSIFPIINHWEKRTNYSNTGRTSKIWLE